MNVSKKLLVPLVLSSLMWGHSAMAQETGPNNGLKLHQGTMQAGGQVKLAVRSDLEDSNSAFSYQITPQFGYFLIDNLELNVGIGHLAYIDDGDFSGDNFFFNVGARYIFDLKSLFYPYVGLKVGLDFVALSSDDPIMALAASVPAGVLFRLNEHVALNLGLSLIYRKAFESPLGSHAGFFNVDFGYIGIEAFF